MTVTVLFYIISLVLQYKKFEIRYPGLTRKFINTYEFTFENIYDPLDNELFVFEALQLDCAAFIFLYDISNKDSFQNVAKYIKNLYFNKYPDLKIIFVGNKIDDENERLVSLEEVQKRVFKEITDENIQKNNINFFEVSLKDKTHLDELFKSIHSNIFENYNDTRQVFEARNKTASLPQLSEIRISLFGDHSVGKTAFVKRLINDKFVETTMTVGEQFEIKFVKIKNNLAKAYIWDTAGQERFRDALPKTIFQNADGIFLLIDVCKKNIEVIVDKWIKEISEKVTIATKLNGYKGKVVLYLIGNKIDIVKEINVEEETMGRVTDRNKIEDIANKYGVEYFETSCLQNININEIFYRMASEIYERIPVTRKKLIKEPEKVKKKEGGCCGGKKEKEKDKKQTL